MTAVSSARPGPSRTRIDGLDTARAAAILLAMLAHGLSHFGVRPLLGEETLFAVVRTTTGAATPTFIILFGMMLELVYLKMIRRGDRRACWTRLLTRAIQCYLLYLCVVAAGVVGGQLSGAEGVKAAFFLWKAYFANILKFYSLGLVAGILLVELRARFGLAAAAVVLAAIWLSYPIIQALPPFPYRTLHLASFLLGAGSETGPSVLQGMSLAILGMFLGHAAGGLRADAPAARRRARALLAAVVLLVGGALAVLFLSMGAGPALQGFVDFHFRAANHPGYYLIGSTLALVVIGGSCLAAAPLPPGALARLNIFGTSSLFAYAFGNVALNLLPGHDGGLALGLTYTVLFMVCLYGLTAYFQRAVRARAAGGPTPAAATLLARLHETARRMTTRLANLFIKRLLPDPSTP